MKNMQLESLRVSVHPTWKRCCMRTIQRCTVCQTATIDKQDLESNAQKLHYFCECCDCPDFQGKLPDGCCSAIENQCYLINTSVFTIGSWLAAVGCFPNKG